MAEKIEIFGKVLELEDARILDIMIHNTLKEIASGVAYKAEDLFTSGKSPETMISMSDTIIQGLIAKGILECKEFLEKIGLEDVENKEIFVTTKGSYFIGEWGEFEDAYIRASAKNDEKEIRRLQRLYKSKDFVKKLGKSIYMDVYKWIPNIEKLIQNRNITIKIITVEDEEKGVGLFNILQQNPSYDLAYKLLETDPTEQEYYEYCLVKFPEQMIPLVALERLVGYEPTASLLEKSLHALFEKMPHNTEEETILLKAKLEEIRIAVGISESDTIKKVDKMLAQFDIEARTFQNIEFATRELRKQAEADYLELSEICEGVENFDENSCVEHRDTICKKEYVQEIADIFLQKIDDRKATIWKEEDAEKIESVFLDTNINNAESIKNSISEIASIGRTDDKMSYIYDLKGMSEENLDLAREYNEWNNETFWKKYGTPCVLIILGLLLLYFGIGIILICIGVVMLIRKIIKANKEKKAWNLLTLNGTIIHPQVLQSENSDNNLIVVGSDSGYMYCRYCGNKINRTAKYCNYCGQKVQE